MNRSRRRTNARHQLPHHLFTLSSTGPGDYAQFVQGLIAQFRRAVLAVALAVSPAYASADVLTEIARAKEAMAAGNHGEAIPHLSRMIESGTFNRSQLGALFAIRCSMYVIIKEYDLAIDDCTVSLRLDDAGEFIPSQSKLAYLSRCVSYVEKELYDRAIEDCTTLIDSKDGVAPTLKDLGGAFSALCASHLGNGSYDQAIEDCTVAIGLADAAAIKAPQLAAIYAARCEAYMGIRIGERAIADCTTAIELSRSPYTYRTRGWANYSLGHTDEAIADFDQALTLEPKDESAHFGRALTKYVTGEFDPAIREFSWLRDANGSYAYYALWLFLASERSQNSGDKDLVAFATNSDADDWPGAVIAYYLGRLSSSDVFALAQDAESENDEDQLCEAYFYVGQFKLLTGEQLEALGMFKKADETCPDDFIEPAVARAEVRSLRALPE